MAEYIERQAVLSEYDRQHKGPPGGARRIIETFPAADVRPVVLCRDCKHEGLLSCPIVVIEKQQMVFINHAPEFFCASGERKNANV